MQDISNPTERVNQHRQYWERARENPEDSIEYVIAAAAMGHYEAYSYLADKQPSYLALVDDVIYANLKWQNFKQILQKNGNDEAMRQYASAIWKNNSIIIENILNKKKDVRVEDIEPYLSLSSPFPIIKYYFYVLGIKLKFLSGAVFGKNNFLTKSREKQGDFSKLLAEARQGHGLGSLNPEKVVESCEDTLGFERLGDYKLGFEEHRTLNKEQHMLEMLKISRSAVKDKSRKNIIIYVGGRSDNFAFSTKHVLDQFWALPDVAEFWHVNPRHVSLSASINDHNYASLVRDVTTMYEYIKKQNPAANITMYGMCAGSPIACQVANDQGIKFFSDRSFSNINKVVDTHTRYAWWMWLFPWLVLIRFFRSQYLRIRGFDLRQDKLYTKIDLANRALHSIAPPKNAKKLRVDSMTKGSDASLHACKMVAKEVGEFSEAFKTLCESFIPRDIDTTNMKSKVEFLNAITDAEVKELLSDVLAWHKDRKSFGDDTKRDPHVLWPSKLQSRYSHKNPMWRLNLFAATPKADAKSGSGIVENYAYPVFQMKQHEAAVAKVKQKLIRDDIDLAP